MANVFNVAEIIDIGIAKERKRRDFYAFVAQTFAEKPETKDLFTKLAGWEEAHIARFAEIRASVVEEETIESYPGELAAYMASIVDEKLYSEVAAGSFAKNIHSPLDAIRYGMGFEKDAILFFGELLPYMTPQHVEKVQALIDEEKRHLVYLAELKKKYV